MIIAMEGERRGSASVTPTENGAAVKLNLRGGTEGLRLYISDGRGVSAYPLTEDAVSIRHTSVCAAVLVGNGRIVSAGFTGACARDKRRILDEILIREAGTAAREKPKEIQKAPPEKEPAPAKREPAPAKKQTARPAPFSSAITEEILKKAELLFGMLAGERQETVKAPPPCPEPAPSERVPNPFPKTYPGSEWHRRQGEAGLFGSFRRSGGTRELYAVPVDLPGRNACTRPGTRIVIARDGRRYLVTER